MTRFEDAVPELAAATVHDILTDRFRDSPTLLADIVAGDTVVADRLRRPGASFVTLRRSGELRGCIGSLSARRALYTDITGNTRHAVRDPRMAPVTADEWPALDIEVSVLTEPEPVDVGDPAALMALLRPGVDGLTLRQGTRRATFLPAVWESLPEPDRFLAALLRKGGWESDEWPADLSVERYRADSYTSPAPRPQLETS